MEIYIPLQLHSTPPALMLWIFHGKSIYHSDKSVLFYVQRRNISDWKVWASWRRQSLGDHRLPQCHHHRLHPWIIQLVKGLNPPTPTPHHKYPPEKKWSSSSPQFDSNIWWEGFPAVSPLPSFSIHWIWSKLGSLWMTDYPQGLNTEDLHMPSRPSSRMKGYADSTGTHPNLLSLSWNIRMIRVDVMFE